MFSKYFPFKFYSSKFFTKGSTFNASYTTSGDAEGALTQAYSNSGDIMTACGGTSNYTRGGDVWVTILKRKMQQKVEFGYDIKTEIS